MLECVKIVFYRYKVSSTGNLEDLQQLLKRATRNDIILSTIIYYIRIIYVVCM